MFFTLSGEKVVKSCQRLILRLFFDNQKFLFVYHIIFYLIVAKKRLSFRVKFRGATHYKAPKNYHRSLSPRLMCLRLLLNVSDLFYPIDYLSPIPTIQLTISTFLQVARISVNILTGWGRRGCTIAHLDQAFASTTIKFINTMQMQIQIRNT